MDLSLRFDRQLPVGKRVGIYRFRDSTFKVVHTSVVPQSDERAYTMLAQMNYHVGAVYVERKTLNEYRERWISLPYKVADIQDDQLFLWLELWGPFADI